MRDTCRLCVDIVGTAAATTKFNGDNESRRSMYYVFRETLAVHGLVTAANRDTREADEVLWVGECWVNCVCKFFCVYNVGWQTDAKSVFAHTHIQTVRQITDMEYIRLEPKSLWVNCGCDAAIRVKWLCVVVCCRLTMSLCFVIIAHTLTHIKNSAMVWGRKSIANRLKKTRQSTYDDSDNITLTLVDADSSCTNIPRASSTQFPSHLLILHSPTQNTL